MKNAVSKYSLLLSLVIAVTACGGGNGDGSTESEDGDQSAGLEDGDNSTDTDTDTGTDTGTDTEGTISACFNSDLITAGTRVIRTTLMPSDEHRSEDWIKREVTEAVGQTTYEGVAVLESIYLIDTKTDSGDLVSESNMTRYDIYNVSESTIATFASEYESVTYNDGNIHRASGVTRYSPAGFTYSFGLSEGQSFSEEWVGTDEGSLGTTTISYSRTGTYVGVETLTVLAGTFQTCRFDSTLVQVLSIEGSDDLTYTTEMTNWLLVGAGILIQSEFNGEISGQLQSATINDVDVLSNN